MARRPPSPQSLSTGDEATLRRTSTEISNPNVFSDDYALDHGESMHDLSPTQSIDSRPEHLTLSGGDDAATSTREYIPPALSLNRRISGRSRITDVSVDNHRALSLSSRSIADTYRTLSTSSRFSIPRAQSPYRGPTAPSQPYGMYAQATRASSIASESTIRPLERPFIPQGGPEHPYSMYPQNTVPEEVDDDPETHVGLGFPGIVQTYQRRPDMPGNDVGDIVGTDGHIEQLPPYSRYADNVIAKGDMARIDTHLSSATAEPTLEPPLQPGASSASTVELTATNPEPSTAEVARKEGLTENKKRRTCCGMPLRTVVILTSAVVLATVLGGIVGGILGNRHGTNRALASGATTTVWLDAEPAETGPSTPVCPTGHFSVPLNQTQEINSCVVDDTYSEVWGCLDFSRLGINIFDSTNGTPPMSVVFDDYSVRPQLFRYGPQPPDFNGTAFTMSPFSDKDDDELGVALFFSVLFDKLNILPSDALTPPVQDKQVIPTARLMPRDPVWTADYLNVGDKPWYCFWNSTISEFWVFLGQDMDDDDASASSTTASITSVTSTSTTRAPSLGTSASSPTLHTESTRHDPSLTTPYVSIPTETGQVTGSHVDKLRREASSAGAGSFNFPKLVKMVEKRKPDNNVQPYCQQMQVLNDWQIVAIPDVPTILIAESEYTSSAAATGSSKRAVRRQSTDTTQQLGSNCICEWFSI